jgi:hypothetical protein
MQRYLLFDSGCSRCRNLAADVEREAGGLLAARSLDDASMRALLDRARPGWRWEPTLLVVEGDRVRAYTGAMLAGRLVAAAGPRRAARIARLAQARRPVREDRRRFLRVSGSALAVLAMVPWQAKAAAAAVTGGSLEAGDRVLAALRDRADVREAEARYGKAVWAAAQLSTPGPALAAKGAHQVVVLPLGSAGAALIAGHDPDPAAPVLVIDPRRDGDGMTMDLRTPGGGDLGGLRSRAGGPWQYAEPSGEAGVAAISWGCFGYCIKAYLPSIGGICGATCSSCATTLNVAWCAGCVACAGAVVYGCYKSCGG